MGITRYTTISIYHLGVLGLDDESMMDSLWDIFDPEEDG